MPREQLLGLASDVDRLLTAGAMTAAGHDGLSRRARTLRELSQKVTALQPVADAVERVIKSSPREVGRPFLDLVVMARQLRGSLSGSGAEGSLQEVEASEPWQTSMPTREVYAAHDALNGDASSSLLKDAAERPVIGDLRLVPSALAALESGNAQLADVVADKVLPPLGRGILPNLLTNFDVKGKAADARRLRVICKIDAKKGAELVRNALTEGSPPLKIEAVECLPDVGEPGEAEKVGLELWKGKNKELRRAALSALRTATSDEALEVLIQALQMDDWQYVQPTQEALGRCAHPKATERLLSEVKERYAALPPPVPKAKKGAKKETREAAEKAELARTKSLTTLCKFINALAARRTIADKRLGEQILDLLGTLLEDQDDTLRNSAIEALGTIGTPALKYLAKIIDLLKSEVLSYTCTQAIANIEPEGMTVIPAVVKLLEDRAPVVRINALMILRCYGARAKTAEVLVDKLCKDRDNQVKEWARITLERIQGTA